MKPESRFLDDLRLLAADIVRDLCRIPVPDPRALDEIETVTSVLLAILCAHLLDEHNIGWAAFSAYMVMRAHVASTLSRGVLRIVGTAAGSAAAYVMHRYQLLSPVELAVALAIVGTITLYLALTEPSGYAWLFAGLTFAMVTNDALQQPEVHLAAFAWSRVAEVATGTLCGVTVSALSTATIRNQLAGDYCISPVATSIGITRRWNHPAAVHAYKCGLALAIVPLLATLLHLRSAAQACVSIFAVSMVPTTQLSAAYDYTVRRMAHRFAGCTVGGILATVGLYVSHHSPALMALFVVVGVVIGRHIENSRTGANYIGTQFALAFLVVLVPDTYAASDTSAGFERFLGVLFGIVTLYPVLALPFRSRK
ncbi:FUSC family protein [Burkholderia sp. HI2714]|uniref:FUSC family protein n=1 Tax=Burkholderia TaxID=32008 RepID=UPI000B7A3EC4|nr:FUSC family protein [Burkholderia sp. HI2714]OXJ22036.1 FUSC family protein [Burkholderia sp. HI2714]